MAALGLALAGCGPSQEELATAAIAERRAELLARLEAIAELGSSAAANPEDSAPIPNVAADFRGTLGSATNPAWNAMVVREEQLLELEHFLKKQTSDPPPPPPEDYRIDRRTFGSGGTPASKPVLPVNLHVGPISGFSRYAGYLFAARPLDSAEDVHQRCDELKQVRFLLVVRLTSAVPPTVVGVSKDRPGEMEVDFGSMVAAARLFDLADKHYLGGFSVSATNTPNLSVEYEKFKNSDNAVEQTVVLLRTDLENNFTQEFWRKVQTNLPDAKVPGEA